MFSPPIFHIPLLYFSCTCFLFVLRQICLNDLTQEEEWIPPQSHCQKFYQAPLTKNKVHFVDTLETLQRYQSIVLKVQRSTCFLKNSICFFLYWHILFVCPFPGERCSRCWHGVAAYVRLCCYSESCSDTTRCSWPSFLIRPLRKRILSPAWSSWFHQGLVFWTKYSETG